MIYTYAEFKDFCITHLWKMGDQLVIDNLDKIIVIAESELNRTFKVEDRLTVADVEATDVAWPLPPDYRSLRSVSSPTRGEMKYNIPADFANKRATNTVTQKDYTIVNKTIRLIGASSTSPVPLEVWYSRTLMPFAAEPDGITNWLVQDYFDVYLYCVLKHTAPFLREDERLTVWGALFNSAFLSAMDENDDRKYAGSPLKMKFPANIR